MGSRTTYTASPRVVDLTRFRGHGALLRVCEVTDTSSGLPEPSLGPAQRLISRKGLWPTGRVFSIGRNGTRGRSFG